MHVALLKKEIDTETGMVTIRTAKLKAGQKSRLRVLRVPTELINLPSAQMKQVPGEHVFSPNGSLAKLFDRILIRAGLATEEELPNKKKRIKKVDGLGRKLTAHSFRHTFATLQASAVAFNLFPAQRDSRAPAIVDQDRYCHARSEAPVIDVSELLGSVRGQCELKK
jgi:integrase